jgi:hypothetical protein
MNEPNIAIAAKYMPMTLVNIFQPLWTVTMVSLLVRFVVYDRFMLLVPGYDFWKQLTGFKRVPL